MYALRCIKLIIKAQAMKSMQVIYPKRTDVSIDLVVIYCTIFWYEITTYVARYRQTWVVTRSMQFCCELNCKIRGTGFPEEHPDQTRITWMTTDNGQVNNMNLIYNCIHMIGNITYVDSAIVTSDAHNDITKDYQTIQPYMLYEISYNSASHQPLLPMLSISGDV